MDISTRYYADEIRRYQKMLIDIHIKIESLFDAIKDGLSPEFHPWLKTKIEEHFK